MEAKYAEFIKKLKNPIFYIENFIKIRYKNGTIGPMILNPAQKALYEEIKGEFEAGRPPRIVILKARQLGFSTLIESMFFQNSATRCNVRTLILAHNDEATSNLFSMNKLFYDNLPGPIKPMRKASNAKEIIFDNPSRDPKEKASHPGLSSRIRCHTATANGVGRSDTITNLHASEAAFWDDMDTTLTGVLQSVPDDINTAVIIETTANGYNAFKRFWDNAVSGVNGFKPLFYPWYLDEGYRRPVPPDTEWTEEELRLKETYKLDDEQLMWRRWCISTQLNGDGEMFKQEYPSCPEEAFLMTGNPFFDNAKIVEQLSRAEKPIMRGRYVFEEGPGGKPLNWRFEESADGEIKIYKRPESRVPYVLGGDTAGDGSDRFTAYMADNSSGDQVVQLLYDGQSELYYTQQVYCLGIDYNSSLVGIEINFSTFPEKKLEEWQYPRLYIRERIDDSRNQLETYKLGWRTDQRTRPLILAELHTIMEQNPEMIKSEDLLREMLSFIRNKDMRPEAASGMHDDMVMAAAIANHIRPQQSYEIMAEQPQTHQKLIDQLKQKNHRRY